jgi:hypothetical protein
LAGTSGANTWAGILFRVGRKYSHEGLVSHWSAIRSRDFRDDPDLTASNAARCGLSVDQAQAITYGRYRRDHRRVYRRDYRYARRAYRGAYYWGAPSYYYGAPSYYGRRYGYY